MGEFLVSFFDVTRQILEISIEKLPRRENTSDLNFNCLKYPRNDSVEKIFQQNTYSMFSIISMILKLSNVFEDNILSQQIKELRYYLLNCMLL